MSVRIRLRRVGRKKQPSYRIVVAESQSPRGGIYLDTVGFYNPRREPVELRVDLAKVDGWVEKGAGLTPTVASLVRRARITAAEQPAEAASAAPAAKAATKPAAKAAAEPEAKPAEQPVAEAAKAPAEAAVAPEATPATETPEEKSAEAPATE